eukprot:Em0015g782a
MDNSRLLSSILKAVHFKEEATCFISSNGIKVTVEQSKCVQANAFIQSSLFQYFSFRGESPAIFKINLMAFIHEVDVSNLHVSK